MEARGYIGLDVVFGVDACLFLRLQWRPEGTQGWMWYLGWMPVFS